MSTVSLPTSAESDSRTAFACAVLAVAIGAAVLAGFLPIGFSIVTVFLFAGPHNWLEFRYFLSRHPGRWGRLRPFFLLAMTGIFGLSAAMIGLPWLGDALAWDSGGWFAAIAIWNSALVLWLAVMTHLRSRQNPRRQWEWIWPVACFLIAAAWLNPYLWSLALVYAHPLIALWVLDRELLRTRPAWRPTYHRCLLAVPVLLVLLGWRLANSPPLPGDDVLSRQILQHAGGDLLQGVSNRFLVAAHVFLEMLHYGVWVVAIPWLAYAGRPWRLDVPLARRSVTWRRVLQFVMLAGIGVMLLLWAGFLADYPLTRDLYFTVAIVHVLAEFPFLLRLL